MTTKMYDDKHIYLSSQFKEFKDELCDAFLDCLGKRPFSAATKRKNYFLYVKDQSFMGYDFYSSSFSFTLNDTRAGRRIGIETRWIPNVLYSNVAYRTIVYTYYDVSDNAKYKVDHVASMLFRGFSYSLFIQAAMDFKKISTDLSREIFERSSIETDGFYIAAILAETKSRIILSEADFDKVYNHHNTILNSKLLAKDFHSENIVRDTDKGKIVSVLLNDRRGKTEFQEHLLEALKDVHKEY